MIDREAVTDYAQLAGATLYETSMMLRDVEIERDKLRVQNDRLKKALERVAPHHAGGCDVAMLAVAEARAILDEIKAQEAEDDT